MNAISLPSQVKSALGGIALSAVLALGLPAFAHATVVAGQSSSYDESIALAITPLIGPIVTVNSGPFLTVSNSAPPAFSNSNSAVSASLLNGALTTGLLNVAASSNVDGSAGIKTASGSASIANLALGGFSIAGFSGLSFSTLQSTATSTGNFGALSSTGSTSIANLVINGLLLGTVTPTVNDVLFNSAVLGITIIANAQSLTGDGINNTGLTVNGLEVLFNNALGTIGGTTGLINGAIILDQSMSSLSAIVGAGGGGGGGGSSVPEPSTMLVLTAGLLGFLGYARKYRQPAKGEFIA